MLDRALAVDRQRHHLAAQQQFAGLERRRGGLRAWAEPPLERDSRILILRARRTAALGHRCLVANDRAVLGLAGAEARFILARAGVAVVGDGDRHALPPGSARG